MIRQVCEKPDFGFGSRLRVGKVLLPRPPEDGTFN